VRRDEKHSGRRPFYRSMNLLDEQVLRDRRIAAVT
jgi:hypothetical protein